VSTKSKWIWNSCRQTWLKPAISNSGLKQLKNQNSTMKGFAILPTFTACCCFLLATVSNSTEGSGFCSQERIHQEGSH
jgi:hypothetical protein